MAQTDSSTKEIFITRLFDAPRELVFEAWTDPQLLVRWYAPKGCSIRFLKLEPHAGGAFHSCISTPDGYDCWCTGTYLAVTPHEQIVFSMCNADEQGNAIESGQNGTPEDWPTKTVVTVTLTDVNGQTEMTLHQTAPEDVAKRTGAYPSWLEMFDKLAEDLKERA